ncbi:UNVERIFIED_CONTAM: hypothetical protein Sangu_2457500 [Sesamum angustifolium]|uniref:DUF4218 domain-containing protein n=1 Tax=Sesamum angustifolium TaxID=2727405 RepID=A0AAW2KT78_9LAMI
MHPLIKGKTKDNLNARKDLKIISNHPELELDEHRPNVMPKVVYTLTKEQRRRIYEWIRVLKFLDGYASNIARCVDMMGLRMHGVKSHDCHIFIDGSFIPKHILDPLDVAKLHELAQSIVVIMCNLKKIFPPALFDSMEHLIVHLPYEAHIGGGSAI